MRSFITRFMGKQRLLCGSKSKKLPKFAVPIELRALVSFYQPDYYILHTTRSTARALTRKREPFRTFGPLVPDHGTAWKHRGDKGELTWSRRNLGIALHTNFQRQGELLL